MNPEPWCHVPHHADGLGPSSTHTAPPPPPPPLAPTPIGPERVENVFANMWQMDESELGIEGEGETKREKEVWWGGG